MEDVVMSFYSKFKELKAIEEKLINWDLSIVEGGGEFIKSINGGYGHIELKIYSDNREKVIWSVSEKQLPDIYKIKEHIIDTIKTFHGHLVALRGENLNLVYEVTKSSFHAIDSHPQYYAIATIYAIINCFDKSYREFDSEKIMKRATTWGSNL
ncbi:hypothetical protein ABIB62_002540 [Mucilaginibacter sp. UYP25]|uniref:hypothetical protein n=1 Tax=unclassified Mucilaginibacter TaxID=2617802 RepID=UPI00339ACFC6